MYVIRDRQCGFIRIQVTNSSNSNFSDPYSAKIDDTTSSGKHTNNSSIIEACLMDYAFTKLVLLDVDTASDIEIVSELIFFLKDRKSTVLRIIVFY
jgi:hypothetical protein